MEKLDQVRWGIIGVGDVCEVKSAPAMMKIDHSQVVAVMRRSEEKVKNYAERHQIPKWYTEANALINDPEVNAIYIATPPHVHEDYTLLSAKAGKPVYVEKPMAKTYQSCMEMIHACDKSEVPLFVAYYRRALPGFVHLKQLLHSGVIGDVRFVQIQLRKSISPSLDQATDNWRVQPEIAGDGYFYDLASHQFDLLEYILGPIKFAQGMTSNQSGLYEASDTIAANFQFENGILGSGSWLFSASPISTFEQTTIYGSHGEISFDCFGNNTIQLKRENQSSEVFTFENPKHIQQPLIQQIVDELRGYGKCVSTGRTAAKTNQILEWIANIKSH